MPRISATFKKAIIKIVQDYSCFHDISFSEAAEILAGTGATEWYSKLSKKQKDEIAIQWQEKYGKKKVTN